MGTSILSTAVERLSLTTIERNDNGYMDTQALAGCLMEGNRL